MVDENTVAAKSILKRRVRNDVGTAPAEQDQSRDGPANACKRFVTFDETITVKNEKDLVVKKPMKLELVIEHWRSSGDGGDGGGGGAKTDPGIVRRLVGEFNAVQDPLTTDNPDCALPEEDKREEDQSTEIPLCEALETVSLTAD